MRALICKKYGPPRSLKFVDVPDPEPDAGQVVIDVSACSLNFPDTLIIRGKYQFKPDFPFSPGAEISGRIVKLGKGVKRLQEGMRVLAIPGWGGLAEKVAVEESRVVPIPDTMSDADAASFLYTYATVYHALKDRARIKEGETLLVLGASGGIGTATLDVARNLGVKTIAAASNDVKLAVCREFGASDTINYEEEDLRERIKEITEGRGVDVIMDPVGDKFAEPAFRSMAWKGRYLVVGFAGGKIPKIPLNLPLLKGAAILGVFWGRFISEEPDRNFQNIVQLMQWFQQGKISPHVFKLYSFEEAKQALMDMDKRKVIGKAVIKVS